MPETTEFTATTFDGVALSGLRIGGPSNVAFVLGHGFCGSRRSMLPLAEALAHLGTAYVLDFRGHGASGGRTTLGDLEALDVRAVVSLARRECGASACVVSVGSSMGGIAVLRDAAEFASADAVVSISAPAVWTGQRRRTRLLGMLANESCGALARAAAFWARPWNRAGRTRRRRSSSSATSTSRCCSCTARPTRSWHRTSRAC